MPAPMVTAHKLLHTRSDVTFDKNLFMVHGSGKTWSRARLVMSEKKRKTKSNEHEIVTDLKSIRTRPRRDVRLPHDVTKV